MKNIHFNGSLRFIGTHTFIEFLKKGYKLMILDLLVNGEIKIIIRIKERIANDVSKSPENNKLNVIDDSDNL